MHNEFTAVFERDGELYIAYSPEIPGANGQGRSKDEAGVNLAQAIALIGPRRWPYFNTSLIDRKSIVTLRACPSRSMPRLPWSRCPAGASD